MNNFYFIDKPLHYTSFDIIRVLRKKFNMKKIGHTGTLDPLATGGLLIATGGYTKLIPYLEKQRKEYEFDVMLDGTTESFDLGEKVDFLSAEKKEYFANSISKGAIQEILNTHFRGKITQVPPKYSAIKIGGKRAYDLARQGKEVNIKKREVEIFEIEILDFSYPKLTLRALVSAGTYIRSIASDLGEYLGSGGYVSRLRRTKIENVSIDTAFNIDNIEPGNYIPIKDIFHEKNFIKCDSNMVNTLNFGGKVRYNAVDTTSELYVIDNEEKVSHVVLYDGKYLIPKRKI